MSPFRILKNNIKDGFKSVFRNFSLSLASISCITITLILVGVSVLLSYNVNHFTKQIESDVTVVIFLDKETTEQRAKDIEKDIRNTGNISSLKFESKNKVKEDMQGESEIFNSIMSEWKAEDNPLQDTYTVKVTDINKIGETADQIKKIDGVDIVKYGEGMVETLVEVFDTVKTITIVVVIALVLVTAFLISNTIKIAISSRRRQIEIMRLVGASNSYIRRPFFIEGIVLGFLGSLIPLFACCYGYIFFYDKYQGQLFTPLITLVKPDAIMYQLIGIILIIGIVVGAFGSYRAVRKFLKI